MPEYHRDMSGPLNDELPKRLPWLFEELGFRTTFHDYSYKAMGSSAVELESASLRVRFTNDRGRVALEVASLAEHDRWMELGYLGIP